MRYVALSEALAVHARLAPGQHLKPGGEHLLESALARPATSYAGHELYPGIFNKAAALLEALVQNHPFTDGNKRTAAEVVADNVYFGDSQKGGDSANTSQEYQKPAQQSAGFQEVDDDGDFPF